MEYIRGKKVIKLQEATNSTTSQYSQKSGKSFDFILLGKHGHTCLYKKIWRKDFPQTTKYSRINLKALHENK
ncbi:hypothetical protein AYI68_g8329 [Smittium mucronatum]|uniref:Uncharacterized protein n=1 Tax=Smittium mucronatum TaxID=133383 RepID=A0A1R0GL83_9FUNG|nr:hypothetical protein AYI68_g8329 [Smittium mucronatum]